MEQRHINCKNAYCGICWDDHIALQKKLEELAGNNNEDHLGKYHFFLSQQNINPETAWGWASEESFKDVNILAYANFIRSQYEKKGEEGKD